MKPCHLISLSLFFQLLIGVQCFAQNNIDSLNNVLAKEKDDSFKVKTLVAISDNLIMSRQYDAALKTGKDALALANKIGFNSSLGDIYTSIGNDYYQQSKNYDALSYLQLALNAYRKMGDSLSVGKLHYFMGAIYQTVRKYDEAINDCFESIKEFEAIGDLGWQSQSYMLLSNLYIDGKNDTAALNNALFALKVIKESGKNDYLGNAYAQVAYVHICYGRHHKAMENELLALQQFKNAQGVNHSNDIGTAQENIGYLYGRFAVEANAAGHAGEANKYLDSALLNCRASLNLFERVNYVDGIASNYADLGCIFTLRKEYDSAASCLEKALQFATETKSDFGLRETYRYRVQLDTARGQFKQAFLDQQQFYAYSDTLANYEITNKLTERRVQYENDRKESIIRALQARKDADAKRTRNLQYGAIVLFVLIAILLFINNRQKQRSKGKIEKAYSELRSTQAQLIQSEKMASLGQLTAGIAHEIQNPLNFVNNFSEVNEELGQELRSELAVGNLQSAKEIADAIMHNSARINQHGKRADSIVKGMLQHSRTSSGQMELTDLNALADEYLRLAYHGLRAKDKSTPASKIGFNATIKTDYDESIGKINVIPQDLGRVLLNLYNNAFYAVNEKSKQNKPGFEPSVTVSTKKTDNKHDNYRIKIRICDNGNGIPQNIIDKIYQPFFTTKPTGEGTGLGLSLAYDIVKAHGGKIMVDTIEGEGSEFIIELSGK
jgi:signal transduction histidine kinase